MKQATGFISLLSLVALAAAQCPQVPSSVGGSDTLNDPFTFADGTEVATADDWACRHDEISTLFQDYELGELPAAPESVTASLSGGTLTVTVSDGGSSMSFDATISGGGSADAPVPGIIVYGGFASVPIPAGIATIGFSNDDIAQQNSASSRGIGKFYDLYGSGHSAGAMMAWAWGVSRLIDALEATPEAGIDLSHIGVTGCSRNGKGALVAGAFDDRIALTIPQESGSGGAACWRLSDYQLSQGQNVQTASEIVQENVWLGSVFNQYSNNVNALPIDHHLLAGLVAPRGLFVIENTSMEWLGALSTFGCMTAGHEVYSALGVSGSFGYSQVGNHDHCQFPSSQNAELTAFINKFLLLQDSDTDIFRTDGNLNYDASQWQPWDTPSL